MNKLALSVLFLLFLSNSVFAISIGISPGSFTYENLLREGYAERNVRITTNTDQQLLGHFRASGDIAPWLSFEPNTTNFNVTSSDPFVLKIIVRPPADIQSGSYDGAINFVTDSVGDPLGRAGSVVKAGVSLRINAQITDEVITNCRAGGFGMKDSEIGFPLEMSFTLFNDGNIRINPIVTYEIWDSLQKNVIRRGEFQTPTVLSTVEQRIFEVLDFSDLGIGQYWVRVSVEECGASDLIDFTVVEKGGIADKGVLEHITNTLWAYVQEPIEIKARFKNVGPRLVSAQFKGTVKLDGKIVKVIESEEIDVESGEVIDLISLFTPPQPGRYTVNGRVVYNKKVTFEKGSVINVNPPPEEDLQPRYSLLILYLIIIVTIIFLARKIIRERRRRKRPF